MKVYQWHREGMTLPDCCELLATNDTYPVQAFRYGENAFGFQFHPEVTLEMKSIWTHEGRRAPEACRAPSSAACISPCIRSTIRRSTAGSTASSTAGWRPTRRVASVPLKLPTQTARIRRRRQLAAAMARRIAMG